MALKSFSRIPRRKMNRTGWSETFSTICRGSHAQAAATRRYSKFRAWMGSMRAAFDRRVERSQQAADEAEGGGDERPTPG